MKVDETEQYKDTLRADEILVNVGPIEKRIAMLDNGKLVDFFMEREGVEYYAGSIYKGRVASIIPGIEAAFVDIGLDKNGFLHAGDVEDTGAILKEILPDEDTPEVKVSRPKKAGAGS